MSNKIFRIFISYSFAIMATFGFWYALGHFGLLEEAKPKADHKLQSVSYAPFEKDQSPLDLNKGLKISNDHIDRDLELLSRRFISIRTYSAIGLDAVPAYAQKHGLKVLLGAWVSADPIATQKELKKVIELAKAYPSVVRAVVVGNEALLRREVTAKQLEGYIREVKSALPGIPVTYADVWEFWLKNPEIGHAVDFVTIHILPYWEDDPIPIGEAILHVKKIMEEVKTKIPGMEILIGETGWPSEGRMREGALPSRINQARFIRGFIDLAEQNGWQYNLVEAFDQPWKRMNEGAVGGYWGLYDKDRNDKNVLDGEVSNFPDWLKLFWQSAAVVLLTLIIARNHSGMGALNWLQFSLFMVMGAILIVLQGRQFAITSCYFGEYVWAFVVLAVVALLYIQALIAIASGKVPKSASMEKGIDFLRGTAGFGAETFGALVRLVALSCALIAVLGLVFDARYRSFDIYAFAIVAFVYFWFSLKQPRREVYRSLLGRLVALLLAFGAVFIFINETPLNWQADLWVISCLLLAYGLWQETRGTSLRPLLSYFIIAALAYGAFFLLRQNILVSQELVGLCAQHSLVVICKVRSLLGGMIYFQLFGWISLVVSASAFFIGSKRLSFAAIVLSMGALAFYNASLGAIAFVLATLTFAHKFDNLRFNDI